MRLLRAVRYRVGVRFRLSSRDPGLYDPLLKVHTNRLALIAEIWVKIAGRQD